MNTLASCRLSPFSLLPGIGLAASLRHGRPAGGSQSNCRHVWLPGNPRQGQAPARLGRPLLPYAPVLTGRCGAGDEGCEASRPWRMKGTLTWLDIATLHIFGGLKGPNPFCFAFHLDELPLRLLPAPRLRLLMPCTGTTSVGWRLRSPLSSRCAPCTRSPMAMPRRCDSWRPK